MADDPQIVCEDSLLSSPCIAGDESITYFLFIEHSILFNVTTKSSNALVCMSFCVQFRIL